MFSTGEHQEADDSTQTEITSSLDDEYSPGVFEVELIRIHESVETYEKHLLVKWHKNDCNVF